MLSPISPNGWIRPFIVYMALGGGNYLVYHSLLPIRVFHHIILTILLIYWLVDYGLPTTPLMLPLGIFLLNAGLSSLYAVDQRMAWENLWHWITNTLLFLMAVDWFRQGREETIWKWQFLGTALIVVISLGELLLTRQRIHGALFITNLTGAYCAAMVIPVGVWTWQWRNTHQPRFYRMFLLYGGLVIVVWAGLNRGAFLSLGVALVAFTLLQIQSIRWKLGLVAGLLLIFLAALVGMSQQTYHAAGDVFRLDLWGAGGQMMVNYPTGVGPGLFGHVYREIGTTGMDYFTGAHNLYLNIGAELGVVGLAAGASVLLLFLYFVVGQERTIRQNACLAALAGVAAHMMVDNFPSQNFTFLVSLLAAQVVYEWRVKEEDYSRLLRSLKNAGVVLVAYYCFWLLNLDRAQFHYEQSLDNRDVTQGQLAVQLDPGLKLYRMQVARLLDGPEVMRSYDDTLEADTDLEAYGLVVWGRRLK